MYNFQLFSGIEVPKVHRDTTHLTGGGRKSAYPFAQVDEPGKAAFIPLADSKGLKAVQSAANAYSKRTKHYLYIRVIDEELASRDANAAHIFNHFGAPQIGIFYRDPATVKPRKPRTPKADV
jgi:hypothetical protein